MFNCSTAHQPTADTAATRKLKLWVGKPRNEKQKTNWYSCTTRKLKSKIRWGKRLFIYDLWKLIDFLPVFVSGECSMWLRFRQIINSSNNHKKNCPKRFVAYGRIGWAAWECRRNELHEFIRCGLEFIQMRFSFEISYKIRWKTCNVCSVSCCLFSSLWCFANKWQFRKKHETNRTFFMWLNRCFIDRETLFFSSNCLFNNSFIVNLDGSINIWMRTKRVRLESIRIISMDWPLFQARMGEYSLLFWCRLAGEWLW